MLDAHAAQLKKGSGRLGTFVVALAVLLAVTGSAVWALDLSADQKQKMKAIGMSARATIESQRKTLRSARMDLVDAYKVYKLDDHKAQDAMSRIGAAQKALLESQLDDQTKIRQVLSAEQFADFQKMISSRMRHPGVAIEPPFEEKALEEELAGAMPAASKLSPEQTKAADRITRVGQRRQEAMGRMRESSQQLADLYSKFDLDPKAARKLIDAIHHDQMALMWMAHRRQQAIRAVLTEDQFNALGQAIEQRLKTMRRDDSRSRDHDHDHDAHK